MTAEDGVPPGGMLPLDVRRGVDDGREAAQRSAQHGRGASRRVGRFVVDADAEQSALPPHAVRATPGDGGGGEESS